MKPVLAEVGPYVYEYVESLNNIITITLYNKMANRNVSSNIISKMFVEKIGRELMFLGHPMARRLALGLRKHISLEETYLLGQKMIS